MIEGRKSPVFFRWIAYLGVISILTISGMFVFSAIKISYSKDFGRDETFGLEGTVQRQSYKLFLTWGARGQGSASPLDYIFIKALDEMWQKSFSNIPHNVYYRLNSIFWDLTAGLLVAFLFFIYFYRKTENSWILVMQLGLICMALFIFYFKSYNMHFATQMRPYALWNSLGFVMLGIFMLRGASIWVLVAGVLLAFTSSGALLQIPALAFCRFLLRIVDQESVVDALKETLAIFTLPVLVAGYYASHADKFIYVTTPADYQKYTDEFYSFWKSKGRIPLVSGIGILLTIWNRQWRGCTAVFLMTFLLYWLAPVINKNILSSGFFFTSRQYLYLDLIYPFFLLMLALVLPGYWQLRKNKLFSPR